MKLFEGGGVMMLYVNRDEALSLIKSLSGQLLTGDPNTDRVETFLDEPERRDFSIAVRDTGQPGDQQ